MKEIICRDGEIALVDDDLYEDLFRYNWYLNNGYPTACIKRIPYTMHKFVLGHNRDTGLDTHHKNENKLDNQRHNLEQMTSRCHQATHLKKFNFTW
jgi:hypothetical protein